MEWKLLVPALFISLGAFFMLVGSIGLIRLPDFYSRTHATSNSDALGVILIILGLIIFEGFNLNSAKLLIILAFVALTNPTAAHALARAAYLFRLKPRLGKAKDKEAE